MEKRVLYFDCFSGISGDMTIGALLDLGIDKELFIQKLHDLHVPGYKVEINKGLKKGISGTDFTVIIEEGHSDHHHSHHIEHNHHHHSRNIKDIYQIIENSKLNENTKKMSKKIFEIIAVAEAKIHAKPVEEIHFHEIGAIDSIVDIIGTAICIDLLGVDEILASPVNVGGGFVHCEHGVMPVPAPATVEILAGVPVYSNGIKKELTTPTGAGILKALCSDFIDFPEMIIEKTGYGLGKRELETPNVLRVVLGKKKKLTH